MVGLVEQGGSGRGRSYRHACSSADAGDKSDACIGGLHVGVTSNGGDGVTIEIPLQITVRLGSPATPCRKHPARRSSVAAADATFSRRWSSLGATPLRVTHGLRPEFSRRQDPAPEGGGSRCPRQDTQGGKDILHYQNFSVAMHAARRLALVAASNVTADPKLKKPDRDQDNTRERRFPGLARTIRNAGSSIRRLDDKFQLPDVFFTRDRGAFDKGHIVRREDVAWGATYDSLQPRQRRQLSRNELLAAGRGIQPVGEGCRKLGRPREPRPHRRRDGAARPVRRAGAGSRRSRICRRRRRQDEDPRAYTFTVLEGHRLQDGGWSCGLWLRAGARPVCTSNSKSSRYPRNSNRTCIL